MLKRLIPALLLLVLPFLGGSLDLQAAPSTNGWNPETANPGASWAEAGYQGLPDLSRDSAKFLVLNGVNNQSLEGQGVGRTIVTLTYPSTAANVRLGIFDADADGLWDQRSGDPILLFAPRVQYEVFTDPDGSTAATLASLNSGDPLPPAVAGRKVLNIFSNDAAFANADNAWCALYDKPAADAEVQSAKASTGEFRLVFRATLLPNSPPVPDLPGAPGTGLQGTERAGYKLAFNGTYLLPADTLIGFAGGVIDERFFVVAQDELAVNSQDPLPGQIIPGQGELTNNYDGRFDFLFHSSHAKAGDVTFFNADADWNAPIIANSVDQTPTGVPADNGGRHNTTLPAACRGPNFVAPVFPIRDNSPFAVGAAIRWFIFPAGGNHTTLRPENPAFPAPLWASDVHPNRFPVPAGWPNHASVNSACQQAAEPAQHNDASGLFQKYALSKKSLEANPGLWCIRWDGVDASNFVFMKFDAPIGSTPRETSIMGRVFCDENGNGTYEALADTSLGQSVALSIQQVDVNNGTPLPNTPAITTNTLADGSWGPLAVQPGRYQVTVTTPNMLALTNNVVLPLDVTVAQGGCPELLIPFNCRQQICGRIFCDNNANCVFDNGIDFPLPGNPLLSVVITPVDAQGNPTGQPTTVSTDSTGAYCSSNLPFGRYTVMPGANQIPLQGLSSGNCPTSQTVTLGINTGSLQNIDFSYICQVNGVCADIFCDANTNGIYDNGEMRLGAPNWTVEWRPQGQPNAVPVVATLDQASGLICATLAPGQWTASLKYQGGVTFPVNAQPLSPITQNVTVTAGQTPPTTFFAINCTRQICGDIFCDLNTNGVLDAGELPFSTGWSVEVRPQGQPNAAAIVANPDANGRYCTTLPLGMWTFSVKYQGGTTWPTNVSPLGSITQNVTITDSSTNANVNFTFRCPEGVMGKVWCDDNQNGAFDQGETVFSSPNWTVEIRPAGQPAAVPTIATIDATGMWNATLNPGGWTFSVKYQGGTTWPTNVTQLGPVTSTVTIVSGQQTPAINFPFLCNVPFNGFVFCDDNANGRLDQGETTLSGPNWTVEIRPAAQPNAVPVILQPVAGAFSTNLVSGIYTVAVKYQGGTNWPAGFTPIAPVTVNVNAVFGQNLAPVLFTFNCTANVMGRLWCDDNKDGVFDAGETPFVGPAWTVEVRPAGQPLANPVIILPDATGKWTAQLTPGQYMFDVKFNGGTTFPPNTMILTPSSQNATIVLGQMAGPVDYRFMCVEGVNGRVWCDMNANGIFDAGEAPLTGVAGWTVEIRPAGQPAAVPTIATPNASGQFTANVVPGTYTASVKFQGGVNWPATATPPIGPIVQNFTVTLGQPTPPLAFTFLCSETVDGYVFCDLNNNGRLDAGETVLTGPNWTVEFRPQNQPAAVPVIGTPDATGKYSVTLPLGIYTAIVKYQGGTNYPAGTQPISPTTVTVTVAAGQSVSNVNFTFKCEEGVPGRVWCDMNRNGLFDTGENPLVGTAGWSVEFRPAGQPNAAPIVVAPDANGQFNQSLPPGSWVASVKYQGGTNWPATANPPIGPITQVVNVVLGQPVTPLAFTFLCSETVDGRVYCDDNQDGTFNGTDRPLAGAAGWTVEFRPQGQPNAAPIVAVPTATGQFNQSLPLGAWTAAVKYQGGTNWPNLFTPLGPVTQNFNVVAGGPNPGLGFPFLCLEPGDICVKVWRDNDCDGVMQTGEPGFPGIKVDILDSNNQVVFTQTTTLQIFEFCAKGLNPGAYTVVVDGNTIPATVVPGGPTSVGVNLPSGGVRNVIFPLCPLGKICGTVFEDPYGDCDGIYNTGDTPLAGVSVTLNGPALPGPLTTQTLADGTYCFEKLAAGNYTVTVNLPTPITRNIELATAGTVNVTLGQGEERKDIDFGFCTQGLSGRVWKEPAKNCDGIWDPNADMGLGGIDVTVTGTAGNALGFTGATKTAADGTYAFTNLPTGTFEVRVAGTANNQTLLVNLTAQNPTVRTPALQVGQIVTDQDFYYCECEQDLKVRVFVEKTDVGNGVYDDGVDLGIGGIEVKVTEQNNAANVLFTGTTNSNGILLVTGLQPGTYWVCVDTSQAALLGFRPCSEVTDCPIATVVLEPCEDACVELCFQDDCPNVCCEGKLHEVVIETHVWVGDCDDCFAVSAHLTKDCYDECSSMFGEAWMDWCGAFPGAVTGYDGVVTIEDVRIVDGLAYVRVRLTATGDHLLRGYFPEGKAGLYVFVNGEYNKACIDLNCETLHAGAILPWTEDCPEVECGASEAAIAAAYEIWKDCACSGQWFVIDSKGYQSWLKCEPCTPDVHSKTITVNFGSDCDCPEGEDNGIHLALKLGDVMFDASKLTFQGDEWSGELASNDGFMTLLRVWKTQDGSWKARIRIDYDCGCPQGALPSRVMVWGSLNGCSLDKWVRLPCESK